MQADVIEKKKWLTSFFSGHFKKIKCFEEQNMPAAVNILTLLKALLKLTTAETINRSAPKGSNLTSSKVH